MKAIEQAESFSQRSSIWPYIRDAPPFLPDVLRNTAIRMRAVETPAI